MPANFAIVIASLILAAVLTLSHMLIRLAAPIPKHSIAWMAHMVAALALYFCVFISYSFLLKRFHLSALYPVYTALTILGVFAVGVIIFKEPVTTTKIVGLVAILSGVSLLAR